MSGRRRLVPEAAAASHSSLGTPAPETPALETPGAAGADAALVVSRAQAESDALDVLARTLWGEARGEPVRGIEAVAAVILTRVHLSQSRGGLWWGNSVVAVCRKPYQFSCWNARDPNRPKLLAVRPGDPAFDCCQRIARRALAGLLQDPTDGATHYHARGISPRWAAGRLPCAEIGRHLFYKDIG